MHDKNTTVNNDDVAIAKYIMIWYVAAADGD